MLADGNAVEQREPRDCLGVVEREPERDVAASVVSGQREPAVAECFHDRHDVARGDALGMRRVVRSRRWRS